MMTTRKDNILTVNRKEVRFEAKIDTVLEFSTYYVVMLLDDDIPDNNVYAIDKQGKTVWNIGDLLESHATDAYISIGKKDEKLTVISYNGITYEIDTKTNIASKISVTK